MSKIGDSSGRVPPPPSSSGNDNRFPPRDHGRRADGNPPDRRPPDDEKRGRQPDRYTPQAGISLVPKTTEQAFKLLDTALMKKPDLPPELENIRKGLISFHDHGNTGEWQEALEQGGKLINNMWESAATYAPGEKSFTDAVALEKFMETAQEILGERTR